MQCKLGGANVVAVGDQDPCTFVTPCDNDDQHLCLFNDNAGSEQGRANPSRCSNPQRPDGSRVPKPFTLDTCPSNKQVRCGRVDC